MSSHCNKGFTLIEMVISLVLLSFITIIGYQGLFYSANNWQKGHDKMLFQYDHHQAVNWMRQKAGSAEKVKSPTSNSFAYFFNGEKHSLEFVSRYTRTRKGGLYVNRIEFNPAAQKIDVAYYLHHPDIQPQKQEIDIDRVTLLPDVRSIEFHYYGTNKKGESGWHESWTDRNTLPKLIRVEIINSEGQRYNSTIYLASSNNV